MLLTLLTDFGLADYYVGAVKGTVLSLAPAARIVDLSHDVPPGDVATAAFLLAAAAPSFPPATVHLAVVDPGVGTARRILVAEAAGALFLAPDNGLLTPFFDPPGAARLRAVERPDLYLPGPGATFHGRDRFAPLAAALLRGEPPAALGAEIGDPVRLPGEPPCREGGLLVGRVVHVDRFGNLVTDLPSAWLEPGPCRAEVAAEVGGAGTRIATAYAACYGQLPPGEPGVLPGSLGTLELALAGDDLARRWGVQRGAAVRIRAGR